MYSIIVSETENAEADHAAAQDEDALLKENSDDPNEYDDEPGGYGDGTFRPNQTCTRGECATFLYRLVK